MCRFRFICIAIVVALALLSSASAFGQSDPDFEIGLKPFGSYDAGNIDVINLSNGSLGIDLPLMSYPQKGGKLKLDFDLRLSNFSYYYTVGYFPCFDNPQNTCATTDWESVGFNGFTQEGVPIATASWTDDGSQYNGQAEITTPDQAIHQMGLTALQGGFWRTADATGYAVAGPIYNWQEPSALTGPIIDSNGIRYSRADTYIPYGWQAPGSITDTNGNQITTSIGGTPQQVMQWTDSMGRTIPAPASTADYSRCPNPTGTTRAILWNFPGVNGQPYPILLCYGGSVYQQYDYWQLPQGTDGGGSLGIYTGYSDMLQYIVLPDNTHWAFAYTSDGNANISQITFPTGGALCYTWGSTIGGDQTDYYQVTTYVKSRSLDPSGACSQSSPTWTYQGQGGQSSGATLTVTDPAGNNTVHHFIMPPELTTFYENETDYPGKTVYNSYAVAGVCGNADGAVLTKTNTLWANGQENEIDYTYDSGFSAGLPWQTDTPPPYNIVLPGGNCLYGLQTSKKEYDYGQLPPNYSPIRGTNTSYAFQDSSKYPNYLAANLLNLPEAVQVIGGPGSNSTYDYDESNCPSGACGNQTSTHEWVNDSITATPNCNISVSNGFLASYDSYNTDGTLASSVDSCGSGPTDASHMTAYGYSPNPISACSDAYGGTGPTSITNPLGQTTYDCYDKWTGLLTRTQDPNGQQIATSYDDALRTTEIDYPDGGKTQFAYPNADEAQVCKYMSSTTGDGSACTGAGGTWKNTNLIVDGLGRLSETQLTSDPSGTDYTLTAYDGMGRKYQVYNATRCQPIATNCGESTWGYTQYQYDALSRPTQVTQPDGSTLLTTYDGRATEVQDEGNGSARDTRISQFDTLGRLTSVCEVSATTQLGSDATPTACGQDIAGNGFLTTYGYDSLSNLTSVTQGSIQRSFSYDSLSRLTSSTNPESNWSPSAQQFVPTTYAYDGNGNLLTKISPLPNQTGTAQLTTAYTYDALNRLTSKSYSDGTPTANFLYDVSDGWAHPANAIGRPTKAYINDCNKTYYSYDSMGRQTLSGQQTPMLCTPGAGNSGFSLFASYDFLGDLTSITDGWQQGHINYAYNGAGQPTSGGWSDDGTGLANPFISNVHYDPAGHVISDTLGDAEAESFAYNSRGWQQSSLDEYQSNEWYGFNISSFAPNGDILAASGTTNGNWTYNYDDFNRLAGSNQNNGAAVYSYEYDRYGNRWQQNGPQTMMLSFGGNNNRMDGYTYDTAGNLLNDGSHSYTYDAENRLIKVDGGSTATYTYDANGRRVEETGNYTYSPAFGVVDYAYDLQGHLFFHAWENPGPSLECCEYNFYLGDRHVYYTNQKFSHTDWLGTERFRGSTTTDSDYCTSLPFGDALSCTYYPNQEYQSSLHFTGQQHDWNTNLDNFGARYYSSQTGRFISPDWSASPTGVPYANLGNPQSLNLYSYAGNNPTTTIDANGHCPWCPAGWALAGGGALTDEAPLVTVGPVGWGIIGVTAITLGGYAIYEHFHNQPITSSSSAGDKQSTLVPGPYAGQGIPARSPDRNFNAGERAEGNTEGDLYGCHTCGANSPGTKSGNWVLDHQPPSALNPGGGEQRLYPQCLKCSQTQGGDVNAAKRLVPEDTPPESPSSPSSATTESGALAPPTVWEPEGSS